jgi:serine/threonine-protein kinase RIM15
LYGFPPFHADSPDKVFENIVSGRIDWHEEYTDFSEDALNFMKALLQPDPSRRLGAEGPGQVKSHSFLSSVDWDHVTTQEAQFIPQVTDPESTDYFDPRGVMPQLFQDEEPESAPTLPPVDRAEKEHGMSSAPVQISGRDGVTSPASDDFGAFSFKNLGILKQANDDVIRKLKTEQLPPMQHPLGESSAARRRSLSQRIRKPPSVLTGQDSRHSSVNPPTNPPSPSTSASSVASSPSYSSMGPSTPGSFGGQSAGHNRRPSEYGALERFKLNHMEGDRRGAVPSRLRTASISSSADAGSGGSSDQWSSSAPRPAHWNGSSESSIDSPAQRRSSAASSVDRAVTVLIAEDNPISAKVRPSGCGHDSSFILSNRFWKLFLLVWVVAASSSQMVQRQ